MRTVHDMAVMIVDDSEINRAVLEETLRREGFENLLALESADEAIARLDEFRPELMILDIMMPGMNGYECCRAVREHKNFKTIPILVQTVLSQPESRVEAFRAGATDFIGKPVYPEELLARVTVHLENRLYTKSLLQYKDRIETELEAARLVQQSILPQDDDLAAQKKRYRLDIASFFKPSSEIGGDFWGTKPLLPNQTALWIVDFSGHGVAAALNAFRLQAYLQEHSDLETKPGDYLSYLNTKLLKLLLRGHFATMFYGIIDHLSNTLHYSCACSPHPILIKADGRAELIDGSGQPLGIGLHHYPSRQISFKPGDALLLYSDALVEAPNEQGDCLSEEQLLALAAQPGDVSADALVNRFLMHFIDHAGGFVADDLTLCAWKRI